MGCGQISYMLVWQFHEFLSEFLANGHLPRVLRQSRLPANDKGGNEVKSGLFTDFLVFSLQLKTGRPVIPSTVVRLLQMVCVGSYNTGERRDAY